MPSLPAAFLERPITHRGLHDAKSGRVENSLSAFAAAADQGYGIELDIQPSADGQAMVFHDYDLFRLCGRDRPIRSLTAAELQETPLQNGGGDTIPTLQQVLSHVAGRVPLLVEIKDQDGQLGPAIGALEKAVAEALHGYSGPVALMSFNPNSVRVLGGMMPNLPRGLTSTHFPPSEWPLVPATRRRKLAALSDFRAAKADFISHDHRSLDAPAVNTLRNQGCPVLCWTIRSQAEANTALKLADNITFEGFTPA